jgi:hypothetical protein
MMVEHWQCCFRTRSDILGVGQRAGVNVKLSRGLCACIRRHDPPEAAGVGGSQSVFHVDSTRVSQSSLYYPTPPDGAKPKISRSSTTVASIKMTELYPRELVPRLKLVPMEPVLRRFDAVPLATGCRSRWIHAAAHCYGGLADSIVCWLAMVATLDPCSA